MDTIELLARLIKCEAGGEGENGMKAVATSTVNRSKLPYGEYWRISKGDLRRIIEQECQYTCHKSSYKGIKNKQNVWNSAPEQIHIQIAQRAINGEIFSGVGNRALWFMDPRKPKCNNYFPAYNKVGKLRSRIGKHCFFSATDKYKKT